MPSRRRPLRRRTSWANPVLAQLLFWRPIPGYQPTDDAFAPAVAIVKLLKRTLRQANRRGEIGARLPRMSPSAVLSELPFGVSSLEVRPFPEGRNPSPVLAADRAISTAADGRDVDVDVGASIGATDAQPLPLVFLRGAGAA